MKKLFILLCALTLCLSATSATAVQQTIAGRFTIAYDENTFEFDDTLYADENEGNASVTWLGMLYSEEITFDAEAEQLSGEFAALSLQSATEEQRQAFIDQFLGFYVDEDAQYVETILTDNDQIPFILYTLTDSEGLYYYAETVINGECTGLYCYYNEQGKAPDDALRESFAALLKSFVPVS